MGDRVDTSVEEHRMVVACRYDQMVVPTVLFRTVYSLWVSARAYKPHVNMFIRHHHHHHYYYYYIGNAFNAVSSEVAHVEER